MAEPWKLILLFEPPPDQATFDQDWQRFLKLAEAMPGLRRELVSKGARPLGSASAPYPLIHELIFDSEQALLDALRSDQGQAAGHWLRQFTFGRVHLLIGPHMEARQEEFRKGSGQGA